jgi:hypothetical protein
LVGQAQQPAALGFQRQAGVQAKALTPVVADAAHAF